MATTAEARGRPCARRRRTDAACWRSACWSSPGAEVTWENLGRNDHNITPVGGAPYGVGEAEFGPGDTYSTTFDTEGAFQYYCSLLGNTTDGMVGTVLVGDAEPPPPPPVRVRARPGRVPPHAGFGTGGRRPLRLPQRVGPAALQGHVELCIHAKANFTIG